MTKLTAQQLTATILQTLDETSREFAKIRKSTLVATTKRRTTSAGKSSASKPTKTDRKKK